MLGRGVKGAEGGEASLDARPSVIRTELRSIIDFIKRKEIDFDMDEKEKEELVKTLRRNTVKIKYWFSDGSTKTWKMENGKIITTWNTRGGDENVRKKNRSTRKTK